MKTRPLFLFLTVLLPLVTILPGLAEDGIRTERVSFAAGKTEAVLKGKITGRESIVYKLNARKDQFLRVSLKANNTATYFNVYLPGRGPGDEALYSSTSGLPTYTGQLYKSGDHSISVFLYRAAARRGETSDFEITFKVTDGQPEANNPAGGNVGQKTGLPEAWKRVVFAKCDHAPLLARQSELPASLGGNPVAIAAAVLGPDLKGVITSVTTAFNTLEGPSEVAVTVTEGGILDDDLLGIRHVLSLARNRNNQWRIVGCQKGELRRVHLRE